METVSDWTELARKGRTVEAIKAYRASAGVGLGEAKAAVEEWLAINLPPPVEYQRAVRSAGRLAERLEEYGTRSGRDLNYSINLLAASSDEHLGYPSLLFAAVQVGGEGCDVAVEIRLSGVPSEVRRQAVRAHLTAGVRLVWVVTPEDRTVTVIVDPLESRTLESDATLDGGNVLPGFSCKVSDLFA